MPDMRPRNSPVHNARWDPNLQHVPQTPSRYLSALGDRAVGSKADDFRRALARFASTGHLTRKEFDQLRARGGTTKPPRRRQLLIRGHTLIIERDEAAMRMRVPPALAESWMELYPGWFRLIEYGTPTYHVSVTKIYLGDIWVNEDDDELSEPNYYELLVVVDKQAPFTMHFTRPTDAIERYTEAVNYLMEHGPHRPGLREVLYL